MRNNEDEYLNDMISVIEKYDKSDKLTSIKSDVENLKDKSEDEIGEIYKGITTHINSLDKDVKDNVRIEIKIIQQHKY